MKKLNSIWIWFALITFAALTFSGCGGSSDADTAQGETGSLAVVIDWGRAIPADTATIEVWACATNGARIKNVRITYPATQGVLTGVPSGPGLVKAYALNSAEVLLASGVSSIQIVPNADNRATVVLDPVQPPVDDDRYIIGGGVAVDPEDPSLIRVTLNALINRADGRPVLGLTENNFAVYDDGIRRLPITVQQTSGVSSKTDIAFVIDTTGSMGGEIAGVRNSIVAFAQHLKDEGHDVRFAGVDFGDEVRTTFPFNSDVAVFQSWIAGLPATGGADTPENPLDAIVSILNSQTWRLDAQRMIIVLTDAPAHEENSISTQSMESVRDMLIGRYVVHSISPGWGFAPTVGKNPGFTGNSPVRSDRDIRVLTEYTGGVWAQMPYDGNIDMTSTSPALPGASADGSEGPVLFGRRGQV